MGKDWASPAQTGNNAPVLSNNTKPSHLMLLKNIARTVTLVS